MKNELNCVIIDDIIRHFDKMCRQINLIFFLNSNLKIPKELLEVFNNYDSISRRLKYQKKKYPLPNIEG